MSSIDSPILVIDSGLGGLTVVRALREVLPNERIVYLGDTARLPYGSKSAVTVSAFVQQIISYFRDQDPKHVVIACNTATALALPAMRAAFPDLPITGVVDPGARAAVAAAGRIMVPTIGVIATESTIRSKAYERAIHRRRQHVRLLLRPTPLLAHLAEEGRSAADPLVRLALRQYLEPLFQHRIDVLLLGCTHYPVYRELIQELAGSAVAVIDSARQCAEDVARRIRATGLLKPSVLTLNGVDEWRLNCFVTDDPSRFQRLAPKFLGAEIGPPQWVAPEDLYATPLELPQSMSVSA